MATAFSVHAQQAPEELAAEVAGCYALEVSEWSAALNLTYHPDPSYLPDRLELTTTPLAVFVENDSLPDMIKDDFMAYYFGGRGREEPEEMRWRAMGRDSLHVGPAVMLAGFRWHLSIDKESLRGEVSAFTDYTRGGVPSTVFAPVIARPIPCSQE